MDHLKIIAPSTSDFKNLKKKLLFYQNVHVPCKFFKEVASSSIELHTFTDAIELVSSAVSYLWNEHIVGCVAVLFVIGNTIDAKNPMTIPNLELQAVVYGAELAKFVKNEMDVKLEKHFFCLIKRQFYTGYRHLRLVIASSLVTA